MSPIQLPAMTESQLAAWQALIALAEAVPRGWCLVGGQMVQLHCWERVSEPSRPTEDGDAILDVRAEPRIVLDFTRALVGLGFEPPADSVMDVQHRWVSGSATIDILIPRSLGDHARVTTARGGRPIATPGAQNVLNRAELLPVVLPTGEGGSVWRPTIAGALIAKAFAYTVPLDRAKDRHLLDFATLSTLLSASDRVGDGLTRRERQVLGNALTASAQYAGVRTIQGGNEGLARLRLALSPS